MAVRPLNSIAGFSTGDPAIVVVQANGDVTTVNLTANGISNLGNVGNVHITGGNADQYLKTDGTGNLSWDDIGNISSNRAAVMPYLIPTGESYIVNENFQGLYSQAITIDGELEVDGMLIEIQDSIQSDPTQVLFDTNGTATGNNGFTFLAYNGNLNVPGNINTTGSVIPSANDTYDLGSANYRWGNGYFGGNTVYIGDATISIDANGYVVITNEVGGTFVVEGTEQTSTTEIENGTSNVKVYANGNVAFTIDGTSNVMVVNTGGANLTGNLTTGGIKTDNLLYANGSPWNLGQDPGGSNTQIQFNDSDSFGGSAAFTFNKTTNTVTTTNFVVSGSVAGNLIPSANVTYSLGNATHAWKDLYLSGNTLYIADETMQVDSSTGVWTFSSNSANVILGVDSQFANINVGGNAVVQGNLIVDGNLIYVNVEELAIEDPIINLQTGPNGAPLVANTNKDVGSALNYYDTQARVAFMGWDNSNAEFAFGSQTTISSEVVTFDTLGNIRAQTFKGNIEATTISGSLTTASQANITTVGTLGSLSVTGNVTPGNVSGANTVAANYLVSNSGCVSVNGAFLAYNNSTGAAGIFSSLATDINLGLAANITMGSTSGDVTARGNLIANNISTTGNLSANLITGTLTTAAQANITTVGTLGNLSVTGNTVTNLANANTILTQSVVSKRTGIAATTLTVVDSFSTSDYRTAKYVVSSQNDDGFESLEVLLIHNDINSYITVYAAINDGGGNTVTFSTGINSGNVELRATGLAANTVINLIGTYVPD